MEQSLIFFMGHKFPTSQNRSVLSSLGADMPWDSPLGKTTSPLAKTSCRRTNVANAVLLRS